MIYTCTVWSSRRHSSSTCLVNLWGFNFYLCVQIVWSTCGLTRVICLCALNMFKAVISIRVEFAVNDQILIFYILIGSVWWNI